MCRAQTVSTNSDVQSTLLRAISCIKGNTIGFDGINIATIRLCVPYLLPFITHIINYCIERSVMLVIWKRAKIITLFKVACSVTFDQIRLISILPTFSKILEKVIEIQLRQHRKRII